MRELRNPAVRTIGFSPDGSDVLIWTKIGHPDTGGVVDAGWAVPTLGGTPRPYRPGIAELDWSPNGKRIAYHTAAAGDPLYVGDAADRNEDQLIHVAPAGMHGHFPLWSRDGRFIYFVRGVVPDEMDVWRVRADHSQAEAERLTFHGSRVSFPTMLDDRTLLYLATANDGSGPWIHALDLDRRRSRRIDTRGQAYSSLAASADGSRLVATEVRSTTGLWRMPLSAGMDGAPVRLDVPSARASSPRFGPRFIAYRAANGDTEGIWKLENGAAIELWSETNGRVVAGPAVAPNGKRLAFCVANAERTELYVMDADGSNARQLAAELDVRGAPAWSPGGRSIAVGAMHDGEPRLFNIPLDGGEPVALTEEYAVDPVWSPSETFIVFSGADVGTNFSIRAVNADGTPHALPELALSRGSRRLDFLDENRLVLLKGSLAHKEVWLVDLRTGQERQLTELGPGPLIGDFDVSTDGLEIVFDRLREESDIVLIERAQARAN